MENSNVIKKTNLTFFLDIWQLNHEVWLFLLECLKFANIIWYLKFDFFYALD